MLAESLLGKMCSCCDSNICLEEETVRGGEGREVAVRKEHIVMQIWFI